MAAVSVRPSQSHPHMIVCSSIPAARRWTCGCGKGRTRTRAASRGPMWLPRERGSQHITASPPDRWTANKPRPNSAETHPTAIPVSIIGRLAVYEIYAGKALGADMLSDALRRIALAAQEIGIAAVLIHAKDERAKQFYLKQAEFLEFPDGGLTLFLPVETVLAGFG